LILSGLVACRLRRAKENCREIESGTLPDFDDRDRYPDATAHFVTATVAVKVGAMMTGMKSVSGPVSVFVNHTSAHQGCQCQQPGQQHSLGRFHGSLVASALPTRFRLLLPVEGTAIKDPTSGFCTGC
jgi:hypothetical protein